MADIAKFIEEIKGMTVVELNELVKALEEEFGVSAAAPVAVAAAPAAGAAAPAEEEKTEFNVKLKEIGAKKIEVIKAVREFTSLGLAEAKKLVEDLGMIKEGVNKEEAEKIVARMKEAGAVAVMEYFLRQYAQNGGPARVSRFCMPFCAGLCSFARICARVLHFFARFRGAWRALLRRARRTTFSKLP